MLKEQDTDEGAELGGALGGRVFTAEGTAGAKAGHSMVSGESLAERQQKSIMFEEGPER